MNVHYIKNQYLQRRKQEYFYALNLKELNFYIQLNLRFLIVVPFDKIIIRQIYFKMKAKSTVQNSRNWRLWHFVNYIIGGSTFLLGSLALFPFMGEYIDIATTSAWLYTLGSFTFLLADITQWLHYTKNKCPFLELSINFAISAIGSTMYLVGSACFIPKLDLAWLGQQLFIFGSAVIALSQAWKLYRQLSQKGKTIKQLIDQDESGFYVDMFAGLGGVMYFVGTFVFQQSANNPIYIIPAATIYSFGGLFFFGSGLFIQKRYFQDKESGYFPAYSINTVSDL